LGEKPAEHHRQSRHRSDRHRDGAIRPAGRHREDDGRQHTHGERDATCRVLERHQRGWDCIDGTE
jgi:hypothetical protein